ncbi:SDR family NAD(P)-dependent oxidoreductase [Bacillus salitolerans]|uniref:SDR family NAD(P)-dependent oxidoreductase n=1 Tax=Bacillus salitolerans TaxID=1437434 RepID=A0ABW4LX28_9BACI
MRLKGKRIVITGASGGIGEQIAYKVAQAGGTPILLARTEEKLQSISEHISKTYCVECPYFQLNVQDLEEIDRVFSNITRQNGPIHGLINNAGFGIFDHVIDMSLDDMKSMFEVNVFGLMACTKMVLPQMFEKNEGHIINIASQAGKMATPKSSVYSATKHAVLGFTNSLRMELAGSNVYVTAVNPGPIRTNFFQIADKSGGYVKNIDRYMLDADYVATKVVDALFTRTREINLPGWMNIASTIFRLFPGISEKLAGKMLSKK